MIVYAVITNVSLGQMFMAGIIPGIILVFFLAVPAVLLSILKPGLAPPTYSVPWKVRFTSLKGTWAILLVLFSILGSIYFGIATTPQKQPVLVALLCC